MNQSIAAIAYTVLEVCWRRRRLLVLPMALILALGLIYARMAPKTYVAKALMLLQETNRGSPLSQNVSSPGRVQERLEGMQALLKSERVLKAVMGDIADEATVSDTRKAAAWMKGFANSLSLDLVGSDFLELKLRRDSPVDLGAQVNAVTFRFFEALLSSSDALNATQVVLDTLKIKLDHAEAHYERSKEEHLSRAPKDMSVEIRGLQNMRAELEVRERELEALDKVRENLTLRIAAAALRGAPSGSDAPRPTEAENPSADEIAALREIDARHATLTANVNLLRRAADGMQVGMRDAMESDRQLRELEAQLVKARENYQDYAKRFIVPTGSRTTGLLGAPERIKLIDAPRDPDGPERSALKIVLLSLLASVLSGAGLVFLAEMLDTTVRRSKDIAEMTGVPVLARLPAA